MIKDYFNLAFKNLKHRGIRSWLTLLGIFIGVTAVVALIGLGNGLKTAVSSQFGVSSTELITIQAGGINMGPPGTGVTNPLTTKDLNAISNVNNVDLAIRINLGTVKLETRDKKLIFASAMNIPKNKEERTFIYDSIGKDAIYGQLLTGNEVNEIIVGYEYSVDKKNGNKPMKVGDKLTLNGKSFKIKGILDKTGSFIYDYIILVNEDELKNLLDYGDEISLIDVKVKDKNKIDQTKEDIEKALRKQRGVKESEEDFTVSTPEASLSTVNSILTGIQIFIIIIASISVFIGVIGIVNTMTTSVIERRNEIGIMKSIGARNENIFAQFFIEAGLLGLVGEIAGALTGTLISVGGILGINYQFGTKLIPSINIALIIASLTGSFLIGAIAGIVPAMNAANQNPVDALRN